MLTQVEPLPLLRLSMAKQLLSRGQLEISKSLSIDASGLNNGLTIDANGSVTNHRVMEVRSNSFVTLHSLTLTGGNATGFVPDHRGGAIYSHGTSGNSITLTLIDCIITGNSAEQGGGIFTDGSISGNASLSITSTTISDNSAEFRGGGILSDGSANGDSTISITSSTVSHNSARFGGGIYSNGN